MQYTTYEFYAKSYKGTALSFKTFARYVTQAQLELDRFTFGRLKGIHEIPEEAQYCICEMSEYMQKCDSIIQGNGISSETSDGYSVTYEKEKNPLEIRKELYQIACKHLEFTKLLYRG